MDLHPYDGVTRRFGDGDGQADGPAIVARILGLAAMPPEAHYEMSFYSGGIGVLDHVAIGVPLAHVQLAAVRAHLGAEVPDLLAADPEWGEDFLHLVTDDDAPCALAVAVATFVEARRASFQPPCVPGDAVWFEPASTVNGWSALWVHGDGLGYLGFVQG